ncbi:hypothetical protein [Thioclava sp. DLFJ4-1]|uniref:putative PDDEXK endonuclease n=1 Tax=Thioclava sp. DLFJ4-1 TaxID=1915313 RepID=UPI000998621F|nr:hypothetical protein [Thioclava sp. DLFJ4-1]OOY15083.1 hypothetical protein BMI85_16180 [Thioclava sp. DLFJ4-1]
MGKMSRNKGATFERECASALHAELGLTFSRNLRQYQTSGHGDLTTDHERFPFSLECKRYGSGAGCRPVWQAQAAESAESVGKFPAVLFRFDGATQIRVSLPVRAMLSQLSADPGDAWAEISFPAFCALCREMMADAWMANDYADLHAKIIPKGSTDAA